MGLFLEILPNSNPANFSSLIRQEAFGFEANIGVVKQIEYLSLFIIFAANNKGKLVLD